MVFNRFRIYVVNSLTLIYCVNAVGFKEGYHERRAFELVRNKKKNKKIKETCQKRVRDVRIA